MPVDSRTRRPVSTRGTEPALRFQPLWRAAATAEDVLFDHHGTTSDRAFGRVVHAVLHQALVERENDPLTQKLLKDLASMRPGQPRRDHERELIAHEMRRASRLLATHWDTEKHNFGADSDAWRARAADYIGRYVSTDDYLFANVWHYPLHDTDGNSTLVPMLEFPFRVRTRSGVILVGRFDRVDDVQGRPVVIDYKTGPPRSMVALRHDHQLLLYATAVADLTGARSVTCEIHWLSTGTKSSLVFTGIELRRAREEAGRYVKQVERHQLFGTPSPEAHVPDPLPRPVRPGGPDAAEGPLAA